MAVIKVGVSTKRSVKTCVPRLSRLFKTAAPVFTEHLYQHRGRHGRTDRCIRKSGKGESIRRILTIPSEREATHCKNCNRGSAVHPCCQLRLGIKPLRHVRTRLVYHDCNIVSLSD